MPDLKDNFIFDELLAKNFVNTTIEERELIRNCRNHINIRKWMYSDSIISPEEHMKFLVNLETDDKNYFWLIQKGPLYIGVISLNKIDFKNKNAYLGIYSNPYCKIKGKGKLLAKCFRTLSFDIAKLHTLKIEVIENNEHAINFYRGVEFREEGRLKEFIFKDKRWYDMIVMGIIKEEDTYEI